MSSSEFEEFGPHAVLLGPKPEGGMKSMNNLGLTWERREQFSERLKRPYSIVDHTEPDHALFEHKRLSIRVKVLADEPRKIRCT
jgi:hypothetical protein